jgi:hypothetical protein
MHTVAGVLFPVDDFVIIAVMSLICFVPLWLVLARRDSRGNIALPGKIACNLLAPGPVLLYRGAYVRSVPS